MFGPHNRRLSVLVAVVSNLVPVAGVLALGWSASAFLGVYVLELWAVAFFTVLKAPFARKRPNNSLRSRSGPLAMLQEKRGSIALPLLPPVYPRNLPVAFLLVFAGGLEVAVGFVLFALTDPAITEPVVSTILLGGVAVFLARAVDFAGYLRGAYREHSPRSLALVPLRHLFWVGGLFVVVLVLGTATGSPDEATVGGRFALVVIAAGKLIYDLREARLERTDDRGLFARLYGSADTEIEPVAVETPARDPDFVVRPRPVAVLAHALLAGAGYALVRGAFLVVPATVLFGLVDPRLGIAVGALVALPFVLVAAAVRYLRYGTREYRFFEDVVVAHDVWLDEPQRRLEYDAVCEVSASRSLDSWLFGTRTVELDADEVADGPEMGLTAPEDPPEDDANANRSIRLVGIEDAEQVREAVGESAVSAR